MVRSTIIFGSQAVNEYEETRVIRISENIDGYSDTIEFGTQAEMNAYHKGLSDADGWGKVMALEPVFTQTANCNRCADWLSFFSNKEGSVYCPDCGKRLDEPIFDIVTLNGHEFNIRILGVEGNLDGKIISTENLNAMLLGEDGDYISQEARQLDETIFFYVPIDKIALTDIQLAEYITQNMK